jgi:DNA-binding beta-propeller fold protein YncE
MRRFGVLMVALMLAAVPASAQRLFGTTGQGSGTSTLVELDPATGAVVSTIGDVGYLINGLEWDASSGTLYATTSYNDATLQDALITIDPMTGAGTPVAGSSGIGQILNPTSNSAGDLYGWTEWGDDPVIFDTVTGLATVVGESGVGTSSHGLAFNPADVLFLMNGDGNVYTLDTATGAATLAGSIGAVAHHGDFNPASGLYYGIDATGSGAKNLLVADLSSFTVIDTLPTVDNLHTLTFIDTSLKFVPGFLESRLYPGGSENQELSVLNYGRADANVFLLAQQTAGWVPSAPMHVINLPQLSSEQDTSLTSHFITAPAREPAAPLAAGDVLNSWPTGLTIPWGTGFQQFSNHAWIADPGAGGGDDLDHEFTAAGAATGNSIDTSGWIGSWAGDMAFDPTTSMLWQVNVGGDNCIYELDPAAGAPTGASICFGAATSERGLAYDPVSDTFFIGGWNSLAITRFDRTGAVLQVANVGLEISGLAYNPVTEHLFAMTNASPNLVYVLDVADSYNLIGSFGVPGFGDYDGAGLAISCDGHLWAANQGDGMVYEFDSGETSACLAGASLPWLVLTPNEGLVPAAGTGPGELPVDAEFIADGTPRFGLVQANISLIHYTEGDVEDASVCLTKSFYDMTPTSFADAQVHSIAGAGITTGCGGGDFCPASPMTRGVMARWLMLSKYGPGYGPPPCTGIFGDVQCENTANAGYIEALYNEGITAGCSADPLLYCPNDAVTRAQMAVFLLKTSEGSGYVPPPCVGIFGDVACPGFWAVDWIEELYARGITAGCSASPLLYCPNRSTTRSEMAVFVQKTFDTPMCDVDN